MGRPLRIEYPGALYHITSRGNERKEIFLDDADRVHILEIIKDYHARYGILIHGYVLMDNHYHLLLETPKRNILKVMHGLNGGYTGYFNRRYGRSGHLFQGRYRGILVERDTYLIPLSRYIHLNPVRAKLVDKPEEYPWSSYLGYVQGDKEDEWVEYSWVLSQFGNARSTARREYRRYVEEGLREKSENPLNDLHGQVVLGKETFIEKVKEMVKGKSLSNEIVERKRFRQNPLPDDIIKLVSRVFKADEETIMDRGNKNNSARKAAIYFVQRYSGLSNEEVGKVFGGLHPSAISKASMRLKQAITCDKNLVRLVEEIESRVKA